MHNLPWDWKYWVYFSKYFCNIDVNAKHKELWSTRCPRPRCNWSDQTKLLLLELKMALFVDTQCCLDYGWEWHETKQPSLDQFFFHHLSKMCSVKMAHSTQMQTTIWRINSWYNNTTCTSKTSFTGKVRFLSLMQCFLCLQSCCTCSSMCIMIRLLNKTES